MPDLARLTDIRALNEARRQRKNVTPHERARIIELLGTHPLPEVARLTGRAIMTLARIAQGAGL